LKNLDQYVLQLEGTQFEEELIKQINAVDHDLNLTDIDFKRLVTDFKGVY